MNQSPTETVNANGRAWLAFVVLSAVPAMLLGMDNAFRDRTSMVVLAAYTALPLIATRSFGAVGIGRQNLRNSILVGSAVGITYGVVRGLMLRFVTHGSVIFGADLARAVAGLRSQHGVQLGPVVVTGYGISLLFVALIPFFLGIELYFRGFLFRNLRAHVGPATAIGMAAATQAIARRTPHSLVMGSIAGVLMNKYDNILAPLFFHGCQFFVAGLVVAGSPRPARG